MARLKVLGIAAGNGIVAYVVLHDDKLVDWQTSEKAACSSKDAYQKAREWINRFEPEVVATEAITQKCRKRGKTLKLLAAIENASQESDAISLITPRVQTYPDKYQEAAALARQYPELLPRLPKKPPIWKAEPHRMILFEALALALRIKQTS